MKKRWLSLYVENNVGVLAMVSGMFAGKLYNLLSLSVGVTEDATISRMTICLQSDDATLIQIKKQLERCIDVLKVMDLTEKEIHAKELMLIKVNGLSQPQKENLFRIAPVFHAKIIDCGKDSLLLETVRSEAKNEAFLQRLKSYSYHMEVVRSGALAVERC